MKSAEFTAHEALSKSSYVFNNSKKLITVVISLAKAKGTGNIGHSTDNSPSRFKAATLGSQFCKDFYQLRDLLDDMFLK